MKNVFVKSVRWFFKSVLGQKLSSKAIIFIHKASDVNILMLGYKSIGILNYKSMEESGELNVLLNILKPYFKSVNLTPIIFDVGANTGGYYKVANLSFPDAKIYSFEPNPLSFEELQKTNPNSFNIALGNHQSEITMYRPKADLTSSHFTTNKGFLNSSNDIVEIAVKQFTLSDILKRENIERIDFLKIDTEGHDLQVLKGADKYLLDKIAFIQFEINESLLENRILLKDFYEILTNFKLYRLLPTKILNINEYSKHNEIFLFQNILAINNSIRIDDFEKYIQN